MTPAHKPIPWGFVLSVVLALGGGLAAFVKLQTEQANHAAQAGHTEGLLRLRTIESTQAVVLERVTQQIKATDAILVELMER